MSRVPPARSTRVGAFDSIRMMVLCQGLSGVLLTFDLRTRQNPEVLVSVPCPLSAARIARRRKGDALKIAQACSASKRPMRSEAACLLEVPCAPQILQPAESADQPVALGLSYSPEAAARGRK